MRYTPERKEAVLRKMLPLHNRSIPELAEEEGILEGTLYNWRKAVRERLKTLERELKKKEKALAETAVLLVLSKIAEVIWGEGDDT